MAWGRKTTAAQTPAWNQDDYHTAFAGKLKGCFRHQVLVKRA